MTPKIGLLFSIKAILTVNSSFFLINSLVPSKGSTNQYLLQFFLVFQSTSDSSLKIGILESKLLSESMMNLFEVKLRYLSTDTAIFDGD